MWGLAVWRVRLIQKAGGNLPWFQHSDGEGRWSPRTNCLARLCWWVWTQSRDPASVNKVETNWERHPHQVSTSVYPHTHVNLHTHAYTLQTLTKKHIYEHWNFSSILYSHVISIFSYFFQPFKRSKIGTGFVAQLVEYLHSTHKAPGLTSAMVWMRMCPIGSGIWMLRPKLVELFREK